MKRRPAGTSTNAVSLFPFLAVLLCTMGALIVLLIVVARQARIKRYDAPPIVEAKVDPAEAEARREELTWKIEHLTESRRKTAEQLAEQRSNLSHVEDHAQRLRTELAELESAAALLSQRRTLDADAQAKLRAELNDLQARAAKAEADLAIAKAKGRRPPSFAVIPYDGENGTRRRPIYIECRSDAVIIQPEGIVFSEGDFAGSLGASNPLAACLRATSEHYARAGNLQPGELPYPLLLVRPDGIPAYYLARAAMETWDSDFGYELIDADWPLEFPAADPQLQMTLARTQDEARRRQILIARAAPRLQTGRAPSFQMVEGGNNDGPSGYGGNGGPNASGEDRYASSGPGGGAGGARYSDDRYGNGPGGSSLPGGSGVPGGGYPTGANGVGTTEGPGLGNGGPNLVGGGGPAYGTTGAGNAAMPGGGGAGMSGGGEMTANDLGTNNAPGGNGLPSGNVAGPAANGTMGSGATADPNAPSDGPQLFAANQPGNGVGSSSFGTPTQPGGYYPGARGNASPVEGAMQSGGGPSGSAGAPGGVGGPQAGASGAAGDPNSASGGGSPSLDFNAAPPPGSMPQSTGNRNLDSLAKKRGKDWGLPQSTQRATGITRPVQIYCSADRLTVLSNGGADRQINLGPRTEDAVDELVSTVWNQIDSWGIAGSGMYWKPVLSMHVAPDGTERFEELKTLLAGSGLEVTGKTATAAPSTARRP